MKQVSFLNCISLVILGQIQGFSALTPVFVQTGEDVVLDSKGTHCSEDDSIIFWKFNRNDILVRFTCSKDGTPKFFNHTVRTEITGKTSLKLKNCQKSFSGLYSVLKALNKEEVVAEYNVTVEDPVSTVHLNVNSVFKSSNFCNLTVTCRTNNSHISSSFTCGNKSCQQDDGQRTNVTKQGNLLQIYLSDESVICNHSNHVSWSNSTEKISCLQQNQNIDQTKHMFLVSIIRCTFILVMIVVVLIFLKRKRSSAKGF